MSSRTARLGVHALAAAAIGLVLWLAWGRVAAVNYDSAWSLDWMRGLVAGGTRPDLERVFSPTPHPLSDLVSALLTPLSDGGGTTGAVGEGSETALIVVAMLALGALGVVTFRLGRAWFGTLAGVLAAVVILTREPVLSYGLRTYLDLPYAVFLLLALLAETQRPRNGARTIAWITAAGLLRPEAWLLAAAYVGYLVVARAIGADRPVPRPEDAPGDRPRLRPPSVAALWAAIDRRIALLVGLALVAPLGWIVEGLVLTGDPLQALTGTQDNAVDLDRVTGVGSAVTVLPRRLGEIVREPVLLAAAGGLVLGLLLVRRRWTLGVGALIAAAAAFFVLAAAGLPLLGRYLVFPGVLLVLFATGGLLGWRALPGGHRWRRPWQAFAVVALLVLVAFVPSQANRLERTQRALDLQHRVIGDLRSASGDVVRPALADPACRSRTAEGTGAAGLSRAESAEAHPDVALPNHRAVPQVLLWLGREVGPDGHVPDVGALDGIAPGDRPPVVLLPATVADARGFILDRADGTGLPAPPAGSTDAARVGSWRVLSPVPGCRAALRRADAQRRAR